MIISIKKCEQHHLSDILSLEQQLFSLPFTEAQLIHQMEDEKSVFLVAENEKSEILGYLGMSFVLDEGYISNIAVSENHRNLGVAKALLTDLIDRCAKIPLAFISLEVRESNIKAVSLYDKFNFKNIGIRKNYYEKPKENAIIMTYFYE